MRKLILLITLIFCMSSKSISVLANQELLLPTLDEIEAFHSESTVDEMLKELPVDARLDDYFLQLINNQNPVYEQPYPELTTIDGVHYFDVEIWPALNEFITDASYQGHYLRVISGYRTMEEQINNRLARYNSYIYSGYSEADAQYLVDLFYAQPDTSEHLSGLAVDILGSDWTSYGGDLHQDYQYEASAIWMAENAHHYGFILRYMYGKTPVTDIEYEPWHFRYVGKENAQFIYKHGIALEEYLSLIQHKKS